MKKSILLAVLSGAMLSSCTMIGGGQKAFVWPAAWSDAGAGAAKYGGQYKDTYVKINTYNPFTDQDNGPENNLADGTGLFKLDPRTGAYLPYMAASAPKISADGRVYTVALRSGMKFSDGTPITAQDFVTTWKLHTDKDMKSAHYGKFFSGDQPITLAALDKNTLQATFPVPMATAQKVLNFAPWPDHIFGPLYASGGAKAVAALWGPDTNASAIVTAGAWTLASNDNKEGGHVLFKKNPYWGEWNKDSQGRALPYLDGLDVKIVPQNVSLAQSFLAGDSDRGLASSAAQVKAVSEAIAAGKVNGELLMNVSPRNSMSYLVFNWNKASDPYKQALFRNAKFRQAISHLYNRQKVIDDTLGGLGRPMYSLVPLLFPDYIPADLPKFAYDPAAAAGLLAELGYSKKDGDGYLVGVEGKRIEFDVMTYGDPQSKAELDIFVADAKAAGVKVNVVIPDNDAMWATADGDPKTPDERKFDAFRYADTGFDRTWPFLDYMVRCDGSGHYFNMSGKCLSADEQRMSDLFAQGTREIDMTKRFALGQQLNRELAQSQVMIPLITYAFNVVYNKRLGGALPRDLMNAYNGIRYLPLTYVK